MSRLIKFFLLLALGFTGCKERYEPDLIPNQNNFLVVEGYINPAGFTSITLSRTLPVTDANRFRPEMNAFVAIKGDDNSEYRLPANGRGTYRSDSIILNSSRKYRLHIKTASGGEYMSEYAAVRTSPPIDSVYWRVLDGGVQIYTDTHDPGNNTRYYKWDYEETWEYHSSFVYLYKYVNRTVSLRDPSELDSLYYCWRTQYSVNVITGTSAQLTNDVIRESPIIFIPLNSEKTSIRYSILVKQYAIDRAGYDFYKLMRSNTESLGTIFDPQPSEITGNITCVSNPAETVIGYITVSAVQQKRIFISRSEIPSTHANGCISTYVLNRPESIKHYLEDGQLEPYDIDGTPQRIVGYYASSVACLDCTLRGTHTKPLFW